MGTILTPKSRWISRNLQFQQQEEQEQHSAGSSSKLSMSSTSTALQKIKNLRGLQKSCNKNLALLALSGLTSEMARQCHTGKSKMLQVMASNVTFC